MPDPVRGPVPWLEPLAKEVEAALLAGEIQDKDALHRLKHRLAKKHQAPRMPQDPELVPFLSPSSQQKWGGLFRKKPMRSQSGVAIIAVMSSPAACPHGKCIYCPGGPDVDAPQSYTGFEPSTMRAKRFDYDPMRIVQSRLWQLAQNGHAIDKLEIIIQGGTFPARDQAYQDWFVHSIYAGCNAGPAEDSEGEPQGPWHAWNPDERSARLVQAMKINETAACRVIGLTIETKPDWCLEPHVDAMLRHGATRIELGIQTLDEEVTRLTNRGHTVQDAADAMRIARDAGFKVCVHMMPGLPRPQPASAGAPYAVDPDADLEDLRRLFADPTWRPDMLKIYPTLIVAEGETTLKRWWQRGEFEPLTTEPATRIIAQALAHVPEYCRIQRIDRDIPTTHVLAGVMNSNLRQLAEQAAIEDGVRLRDIRAREVGTRTREGADVRPDRLGLVQREYEASGGTEVFLSLEDPVADALVGFLRLRRVQASHRAEFGRPSAVVRELKVYGVAKSLGDHQEEAGGWQHQGHGAQLLAAAEAVAARWGVEQIAVIAGAGVKEYYRKHGYRDLGPYVAKELP